MPRTRRHPTPEQEVLAVAVTPADVALIERLFRHTQARRRRARPDMQFDNCNDPRREELVKNLYTRMGVASTAAASADDLAVPLTEGEIQVVAKLRDDLEYANSYLLHLGDDPMMTRADEVLARLHFLTGRARAPDEQVGVAVFRDSPPRPLPAPD